MAKKRTRRRRTSGRRRPGGGRKLAGIVTTELLETAGVAAAGMVATSMIADRLPIAALKTGNGRLVSKALMGVVGGTLIGKFAGSRRGTAFAVGALASVGVDLYNKFTGKGVAGLGEYVPGGGVYYGWGGGAPALTSGTIEGWGDDDDDGVAGYVDGSYTVAV